MKSLSQFVTKVGISDTLRSFKVGETRSFKADEYDRARFARVASWNKSVGHGAWKSKYNRPDQILTITRNA